MKRNCQRKRQGSSDQRHVDSEAALSPLLLVPLWPAAFRLHIKVTRSFQPQALVEAKIQTYASRISGYEPRDKRATEEVSGGLTFQHRSTIASTWVSGPRLVLGGLLWFKQGMDLPQSRRYIRSFDFKKRCRRVAVT
jgi:hypothetical protein